MTTTPLPPLDTHCFDEDTTVDVWSYSAPLVEQIVKQARADLEAENKRLREALHRIDSVAVFLPTFDVLHEGGIEAVTQNIVEAISEAVSALEKQP